jgi:hypothetical protein
MQYTIRRVPREVDRRLRERARASGKSLNEAAVEALSRGVGVGAADVPLRDLSGIVGTWQDDPAFDEAVAEQHRVDRKLWR